MILVTGTSGFIGRHLLAALVEAYGKEQVLAFTSSPVTGAHYLLHRGYDFEPGYFIKAGFDKIETVIHAGAFTPKNGKQANDVQQCNSNIINTAKLLRAELPNLQKIIYLGTLDVYAPATLITEESPTQPASLYGDSKLYVEKMIAAWAAYNGKQHQLLRIGHVYGPGEEAYQKIIPASIKKLLQDQPPQVWGTGNELRSFIYITDVVKAILAAIQLKTFAGIINLVGGNPVRVASVMDMLISISGKQIKPEFLPAKAAPRDLAFDNSKMKQLLQVDETPLETGLAAEWDYFKTLPL